MKLTKFADIKQFTRGGQYEVDYGFDSLVKFIDEHVREHGLQLNPDFQRGHVWTESQQVAYVEWILRGGITGRTIYLNDPNWMGAGSKKYKDFVVVDGLQRITAIQRFVYNEIKIFGSYFNEYTDNPRVLSTIRVNVNILKTKNEVLQWYIDLNSGGTVHAEEEIERVRKLIQ